jgi:chromodomain-helicase-DNA-binding protein 1
MMPSSPGRFAAYPLTKDDMTPLARDPSPVNDDAAPSESDQYETREHAARDRSSDEDAPCEEDDQDAELDDDMETSDDADAEGEPDGDYDSETPPLARVNGARSQSLTSQGSSRSRKRKASVEEDEFITQNPELYGLRRSVGSLG